MTYQHLSQNERYQIHARMKAGHTISRIAEIIGRHTSTVVSGADMKCRLKWAIARNKASVSQSSEKVKFT